MEQNIAFWLPACLV